MTSKECIEKMVEKYSWLCEQYAILTDRDEISLKGNINAFKKYLAKPVLKDLKELEERRQIDEEILTMDIRHLVKAADLTNLIRDIVILEIFKEKIINFARLKYAIRMEEEDGLEYYNSFATIEDFDELTKKEFWLLKEWLEK